MRTAVPTAKPRSAQMEFILRLFSTKRAMAGFVLLGFFILLALLGPLLASGDPSAFVGRQGQPPSLAHWLGTNGQGQDVFTQLMVGTRMSLAIGFTVGISITVLGLIVGMTAGYLGGFADSLLNTFTNVFLIIPSLPLLITLASFLPPGPSAVILVLTLTSWAWTARVFRSQMLSLREKDFAAAALVAGESTPRIVFAEILPNMLSLVVSSLFCNVIWAIGADVGLAFLGLEDLNKVSWGTMLYWAQNNSALLTGAWWTFVPPGLCVALVAFSMTLIIYAIDEITNPRLRSEKEITRMLRQHRITAKRSTPVLRDAER